MTKRDRKHVITRTRQHLREKLYCSCGAQSRWLDWPTHANEWERSHLRIAELDRKGSKNGN